VRTETTVANESGKIHRIAMPVIAGMLVGIAVSLLVLFVFSIVMTMKDVPQGAVSTLAAVSVALGCLAAGITAAKLHMRSGLATGAVTGFLLYLVLMIVGLIAQGASPAATVLIKFAVSIVSGGIGGIIGVNFSKKQRY
jgi:putative membrane protein (TIGR04086 family)